MRIRSEENLGVPAVGSVANIYSAWVYPLRTARSILIAYLRLKYQKSHGFEHDLQWNYIVTYLQVIAHWLGKISVELRCKMGASGLPSLWRAAQREAASHRNRDRRVGLPTRHAGGASSVTATMVQLSNRSNNIWYVKIQLTIHLCKLRTWTP